jgi:hypothetical protein
MVICKSESLSNPYYRARPLGLPVKLGARLRVDTIIFRRRAHGCVLLYCRHTATISSSHFLQLVARAFAPRQQPVGLGPRGSRLSPRGLLAVLPSPCVD